MAYHLDKDAVEELLLRLQREYRIFAPKRFPKQGRFSDTDVIRYAELGRELTGYADFELSARSTYSAKEVVTPINQTIFHFTPEEYRESRITNDRPILVFLRPCDIHAFEHQDKIYLENGASEDSFYGRIRAKLRFVLIECAEGFDTCFCVSMGSNRSDNFTMAVRQEQDGLSILVKDPALLPYFDGASEYYFTPRFIESNPTKVVLPQIPNQEVLLALKKHPMWDEYDSRCISCGSCTVACSTCTCFSTRDIAYTQNADAGERRRVTASCQVEGFDEMAGGHIWRKTAASRYRYKMLHKYHDYYQRFGETHMCVGCGRCTSHCPAYISMTASIAKMSNAVDEIVAAQGR